MPAREYNFDGLVGPTHNYAGLSYGNLASQQWKGSISSPRAAALEGLAKMKLLHDLGVPQAVLPPPIRPDVAVLRRLGFGGSDADVLARAAETDPVLLAACCSASAMWTANAATVSPSADTADGRVHLTPANLMGQFHRSLELATTQRVLQTIFADEKSFAVHSPPAAVQFSDEGAANHLRLAASYGDPGEELFVYGRRAFDRAIATTKFPARQTLEASAAIARLHGLDLARTTFLQQTAIATDAGAFHADVIAVANLNVMLYHASAFDETGHAAIAAAAGRLERCSGRRVHLLLATEADLPLADAVGSYVFNSQLVSLPSDGSMALIAPTDCLRFPAALAYVDRIIAGDNPVSAVHYVDLRQSMRNGGGPACLRLRVVLTEEQAAAIPQGVILTDALYETLAAWVNRHYREQLTPADLADPALLEESRAAIGELMGTLELE